MTSEWNGGGAAAPVEYFNLGFDVVDAFAASAPNRLALIHIDEQGRRSTRTWWEMSTESNRVANVLRRLGIGSGSRVGLAMPRTPEFWAIAVGVLKRGAVLIPCTSADELLHPDVRPTAIIADTAGAAACEPIADAATKRLVSGGVFGAWFDLDAARLRASRTLTDFGFDEMTRPSDPCVLFIDAVADRAVQHEHAWLMALGENARTWQGVGPTDIHWSLAPHPWTHSAWWAFAGAWMQGATLLVHDPPGVIEPERVLATLEENGVTSFCTTPGMYRALVTGAMKSHDLGRLRECTAAGTIDDATLEAWKDGIEGVGVRGGFGRLDTPALLGVAAGMPARADYYGLPLGGEVAVVDAEGNPCPPGIAGLLAVRYFPKMPPGLAVGLLDERDAAGALVGDWCILGDRVVADQDGVFSPAWGVGHSTAPVVYGITLPGSPDIIR